MALASFNRLCPTYLAGGKEEGDPVTKLYREYRTMVNDML